MVTATAKASDGKIYALTDDFAKRRQNVRSEAFTTFYFHFVGNSVRYFYLLGRDIYRWRSLGSLRRRKNCSR